MKKVSTAAAKQSSNFSQQKLTIGLDLGDGDKALTSTGQNGRDEPQSCRRLCRLWGRIGTFGNEPTR
jgi:hypothetical protein